MIVAVGYISPVQKQVVTGDGAAGSSRGSGRPLLSCLVSCCLLRQEPVS